jgi:hypothetical protein
MYPIEKLVMPYPRFCRITWYDLVYDAKRTLNALNIDLMDFPHLVQGLPIHMDIKF